jgi:hypothetical protein
MKNLLKESVMVKRATATSRGMKSPFFTTRLFDSDREKVQAPPSEDEIISNFN